MTVLKHEKEIVALLVIDPYNDFISEGGKFWGHLKTVAEANNCVPKTLCGRGKYYSKVAAKRGEIAAWRRIRPAEGSWSSPGL